MNIKNAEAKRMVFFIQITLLSIFWMWGAYLFYHVGGLMPGHVRYAIEIDRGTILIPHPGIFWLNSLLRHIFSLSVQHSIHYLLSIHVALTFCAIIWVLELLDDGDTNSYLVLWTAMALMLVAPIGLPFLDPKVYDFILDSRTSLLLRNATHTAVLPYVIISFGLLTKILREQLETGNFSKITAIAAGTILLISCLIKPSFASSILPTIGVYIILNRDIAWTARFKIACILLPTFFLLTGQFVFHFIHNPLYPATHIAFRPWAIWSESHKYPLLAFILATAFPLVVLFYRRHVITMPTLIAWINLAVAIIPYILFSIGDNYPDGDHRDFEWGYLQARQIVFLCSSVEWWRWLKNEEPELPRTSGIAVYGAGFLLIAHALFGLARLFMVDVARIL